MRKPATVVAMFIVSLAVSAAMLTAQTVPFEARIADQIQRPVGCSDGAYLCGEAVIDGFGAAEFRWYLVSFEPVSQSCGDYTAIVTLTLEDGSTLTLAEAGTDCGPGNSFSAYPPHSYGQPQAAHGEWTVQEGTGAFEGVSGNGTNSVRITGARLTAEYIGTLAH